MNLFYHDIFSLGDVIRLNMSIDLDKFSTEIVEFDNDWKQYNTQKPHIKRLGLSITSLDGGMSGRPDLESLLTQSSMSGIDYTENMFTTPTEAYRRCESLHPILSIFDNGTLGRSHILKLNSGNYFPIHRDSYRLDECNFRVIVPLLNCEEHNWVFILDNNLIKFIPGVPYVVNTRKMHTVFSMTDNCQMLVLNVKCNIDSMTSVLKNLSAR